MINRFQNWNSYEFVIVPDEEIERYGMGTASINMLLRNVGIFIIIAQFTLYAGIESLFDCLFLDNVGGGFDINTCFGVI